MECTHKIKFYPAFSNYLKFLPKKNVPIFSEQFRSLQDLQLHKLTLSEKHTQKGDIQLLVHTQIRGPTLQNFSVLNMPLKF